MDYTDPPEIVAFREELRAWIAAHRRDHDLDFSPTDVESVLRWNRDLAAAGYVAVSFPVEYGGRGMPDVYDAVVNQELADAGAPPPPPIGHIAHALADFGSDELKARLLPGLLRCTQPWCQGFSEPGAGSDLASLTTTGRVDGDVVRIVGQKIWTSGAMWSDWCLLLCRTEPDLPRHRGLSMIAVDMTTPGIDRREITMSTGSGEFAEVYFDDAVVPVANLVGDRGQGWAIAMHMLSYERGPADMGWTGRYARALGRALDAVGGGEVAADPSLRQRLARAHVGIRVLQWHVHRSLANRHEAPGAAGSVDKLLATRVEQDLYATLRDLDGAGAVVDDSEAFRAYLLSRAQSIYGGSQQIQRSLVAQRLLGLPRP